MVNDKQLRQIDKLIAEHLMEAQVINVGDSKWLYWKYRTGLLDECVAQQDYQPTVDIAQAWEVAEKLQNDYMVSIENAVNTYDDGNAPYTVANKARKDLPLAICLAALEAKGVTV